MTRLILMIALLAVFAGCEDRSMPATPRVIDARRASIKELQQGVAIRGVAAGAKAGTEMLTPATVSPATETTTTVISVPAPVSVEDASKKSKLAIHLTKVRSKSPQPTYDRAVNDALQVAQQEITRQLAKLEPPVSAKPSLAKIKSDFVRWDTVAEIQPTEEVRTAWKANKLDTQREWVEFDVEISDSQIQNLRSGNRVNDGVRGAALVFALFGAVYGFLRVDALTKGYLTTAIAIAMALAAGLAGVILLG